MVYVVAVGCQCLITCKRLKKKKKKIGKDYFGLVTFSCNFWMHFHVEGMCLKVFIIVMCGCALFTVVQIQ